MVADEEGKGVCHASVTCTRTRSARERRREEIVLVVMIEGGLMLMLRLAGGKGGHAGGAAFSPLLLEVGSTIVLEWLYLYVYV